MHQLKYYRVIRILQIEGRDRHAERARLQLYASGLRCVIQRVRSHEDYVSALALRWPDVLLIGGGLGTLDALSAERIAMERSPYLPIVFATTHRLADLGLAVMGSMLQTREGRGRRVTDIATLRVERAAGERTRELPALPRATGTNSPYPA